VLLFNIYVFPFEKKKVCPSIDNIAEQWSNWDGDQVDIEVSDFEKPRTSILKFQHSALPKILIKLKFSCQRTSFFLRKGKIY